MGQSLSVIIRNTLFPVHNRRYLELEHAILYGGSQDKAPLRWELEETERWTQEAIDLVKTMEGMANQWNYNGSDSQTDYYHVNYSMSVDYDAHDEWVEMTEEIKQGAL